MAGMETVKVSTLQVPQSLEELDKWVAQVGSLQRDLQRIAIGLSAQVAVRQARAAAQASPLEQRMAELVDGISAYAESHRDELTDGGKRRIAKMRSGEVGWRLTPPAITLPDDVKAFLALLKRRGLQRFIRTKEEVDKLAMLKEPKVAKKLKGVTIGQREEFIIKPAKLQVAIIAGHGEIQR